MTDRQEERAERARGAFQLLGPNAAGAIPGLTRIMYEAKTGGSQPQVLMVGLSDLRGLGSNAAPALPTILNLLSSSNFFVRISATNALRRIAPQVLANAAKATTPPPP